MDLPNDWIAEAKLRFTNGCPNGMLLKWDVERFFEDLKSICHGQRVRNVTDFNYAYCNKYEVIPVQLPKGERIFEATISFSFICSAFSFHWTSYSINKRQGRVVPECELPKGIEIPRRKIMEFAKEKGFNEIESDWMNIEVDGIELELADVATLGKCLFDDF